MAETATINGTELAYIDHGRGQPVVFVHGGVGDYRAWDLQMPAFAASFRTIALSCRGAWPNRKLELDEEITLDTFVEDLASFITALDLAPVHLVGHSSPGGFGGLVLARRYPALLRSLVLLEPPAFPLLGVNIPPTPPQVLKLLARNPRAAIGFIKFGARGIGPALKAFNRGDDEGGLRVFMAAVAGKERVAAIPEETFQQFVGNVAPFKAQLRAGFPHFGEDDARSIRVPTLLVSGAESPASLTAVTDRLEELLPDVSRLDIAGASHNMFNSHPRAFNAGVMQFIGQHRPRDTHPSAPDSGAEQIPERQHIANDRVAGYDRWSPPAARTSSDAIDGPRPDLQPERPYGTTSDGPLSEAGRNFRRGRTRSSES